MKWPSLLLWLTVCQHVQKGLSTLDMWPHPRGFLRQGRLWRGHLDGFEHVLNEVSQPIGTPPLTSEWKDHSHMGTVLLIRTKLWGPK